MLELVGSDVLVDGVGGDGGGGDRNGEDGVGSDVVVTEGLDTEIDPVNGGGVGVSGCQVSDSNMETRAEGFEEPVGSLREQIHVVAVEEVSLRANEEGSLERPLVGGGGDATEASILCSKDQNSGTETGLGVSLANLGSSCEQAPVVVEDNVAVCVGEEIFEGESAGEGVGSDFAVTEVLEREIDSINGVGVGASKGQVLDSNMETRAEGFEEPVGSLGEQIHVVSMEEVSMRANEEGGLEKTLIGAGGDATEASVLSSKDPNSGTETELGISLANSGSSCEQTPVVVEDKVAVCIGEEIFKGESIDEGVGSDVVVTEVMGREVDSINGMEIGVSKGRVADSNMETRAVGFEEPLGSLSEQIHVVSVEEVSMRANEEGGLERPLVGGGGDATETSGLCSKDQNSGTETGLEVPLANSGSSREQGPIVVEDKVGFSVGEQILEGESMDEGREKGTKPVEKGDDVLDQVELVSEIGDISNDGVWNPRIEDAFVCSSVALESSSLESPHVTDGVDAITDDEALKYKDEMLVVGAENGNFNDPENNHSRVAEKDGDVLHSAETLNQQVEDAVGGNVGMVTEEEILQPESNFCGSVGNQQINVHTAEENDDTDDKLSSCPTIGAPKSAVSEIVVDAGKVAMLCGDSGSCIAQAQVAAECLVVDESKISISSTVIQNGGLCEPLTTENRVLSASNENIDYVEDQQLKVNIVAGGSEREIAVCTESQSSHDQTEVVKGNEVSTMESISEVEIPVSDDTIRIVACSEDDQDTKCETTSGITESSNEQTFFAGTEADTVMDFKEVSNIEGEVTSVEVLNGYTCIENNEEFNILTVGGSMGKEGIVQGNDEASGEQTQVDNKEEHSVLDCQGIVQVPASCPLDENISFSEIDEELKVETLGKNTVEVPTVGVDSPQIVYHGTSCPLDENISLSEKDELKFGTLGKNSVEVPTMGLDSPQIGDHCTSNRTYANSLEGSASLQDEKKETEVQLADIPSREEDRDQTMNMLIADEKSVHLIGADTQEVGGSIGLGFSECFDGSVTSDLYLDNCSVGEDMEAKEQCTDDEKLNQNGGQEVDMGEYPDGVEDKSLKQTTLRCGNLAKVHQPNYLLVPENEAEFSLSDIVWGKVRSHPWWPGQIFDSADASEEAIKYFKKDCFLILVQVKEKEIRYIEKLSNSEAFQSAVSCALEEVSRRAQLALACSCLPRDVYDKIKYQDSENTGIREESSRRYGVDKSTGVSCFKPDNLLHYIRALAQFPSSTNRMQLVVAKAQLLAFNRLKGYYWLPKFQFCEDCLEKNVDDPPLGEVVDHSLNDEQILSFTGRVKNETSSSHKRKHNLKDIGYPRKKERRLSELMGDMENSSDGEDGSDLKASSKLVSSFSGKKRKSGDFLSDGSDVQDRRISIYAANLCTNASPITKPSFKIGECIRRAASQLTGSPTIVKCNSEKFQKVENGRGEVPDNSQRGRISFPMECSSLDEMLSQLLLTALDPMKGYRLLTTVISFFSSFRNSISLGRYTGKKISSIKRVGGGRKKKASRGIGKSEEYEFDDVNDSYWTDMSIQNNSEEQPSGDSKNREGEYQLAAFDPDKPLKSSRKTYSRKKRFSNGTHEMDIEDRNAFIDKVKQDMSPAELLLNFSEGDPIPSVVNLGKIFKRFGPLKDSETEVDVETSRARVVFKRGADAQVALSSAGTFNILGPATVNYQLNYTPSKLNYIPSISFETFPLASTQGLEDAL